MFTLQLSSGWIASSEQSQQGSNQQKLKPLIQIVQLKQLSQVKAKVQPCRIVISDGIHLKPALLHPKLYDIINNLQYAVVKLVEYTIHNLPAGVIFAISNLEIIANLPHVLGHPKLYTENREATTFEKQTVSPVSSLSNDLARLFQHQNQSFDTFTSLSDVALEVQDKTFYANKSILAARSHWFRSMFLNGMRETSQQRISIPDCDPKTFERILRWIYSDVVDLPLHDDEDHVAINGAWKLWQAASMLCMSPLMAMVEHHMFQCLVNPDNVCSLWSAVSSMEGTKSLQQGCKKYLQDNLAQVCTRDDFLQLDRALVAEIFYKTDLHNSEVNSTPTIVATITTPDVVISEESAAIALTPLKRFAITRWFAANEPVRLKRRLAEMSEPESSEPAAKRIKLSHATSAAAVESTPVTASP
eukprot:TRINITY_DN1296_c0_g1_i1.p1 TRINITY_DN1296_c0_g1~~TRINITY_DN1296_c0_g1_i1.p1  ORF type:complete len:416 (-),score=78.24 TRINITY_DN1296_c0_g1_i1:1274-2521(-)